MPSIHQLPPEVIAQIAAGEVVERPASVVKELVENSIDAGATRIEVDLEQGGTELVRVVDNGSGMSPDDLPLAFVGHATSKLKSADDLYRLHTMGFRGEALSSIGGVALATIQSRTHDRDEGSEIVCDAGALSPVKPWGGAPGTRIEVRRLFHKIPVRRKFLKSMATEFGHVVETMTRLALSHEGLHLVLRHNGKLIHEIPASASLADRIGIFFGAEVRAALLPIDTGPGPARVTGYIADPKCDRGNAKLQYLFVNGRWFRDRSVGHALQEAYRGLLMTGRYAIGFLYLQLPPEEVDVNVHPTKAEVRFRDNSAVYSLVRTAVKSRLLKENLIPQLKAPEPELFASPRREQAEQFNAPWETPASPREEPLFKTTVFEPRPGAATPQLPFRAPVSPQQEPVPITVVEPVKVPEAAPSVTPLPPVELPDWNTIPPGSVLQVHDSYLVMETADGMMVIDQHALHERILYEQLRRRIREGKLEIQRLLIPEPIDLPAEQALALIDAREELAELGLEISEFGGNTILLSSYPTLLSRRAPHEILSAVVDHLVTKERTPSKEILLDHLLATMACKAAVKAGDRLTQEEITYLLQLREMAEDSHHCPHGRPTSLIFSRQDLDRQFRRI